MGEQLIDFYNTRIKPGWKTAFFSVLIFGLAAHLYKFTNTLLTHDSLYFTYSDLANVENGRWFLKPAGMLSSYFDLPWINGLLSLFYLGLTAALVVDVLRVKSRCAQVLTGALLVTFPCMTNTFFFEYTADAYMLSMLLAALAVSFTRLGDGRRLHLALGTACLCLSCGIYQAYLSFALLFSLCHFMLELLEDRYDRREYSRWLLRQLVMYALGVLLYYGIWKLLMVLRPRLPSDYQGLDSIRVPGLDGIWTSVKDCLRTVASFFLGQNVLEHGMTLYAALNLIFLAATALAIVAALRASGLYKRPARLLLFLLCLAAIPFITCIFYFLSPGIFYHPLMLQSLSMVYIFSLLLFERYFTPRQSSAALILFAALVFKFTVHANCCYHEMDRCMERSRSMGTEILTRVHMLDRGQIDSIVIVDYDYSSAVMDEPEKMREIAFSANQVRTHLLYYNQYAQLYLHQVLSCDYESNYDDIDFALTHASEVEEMDTWPKADSVRVIGSTAVIKLPEQSLEYY